MAEIFENSEVVLDEKDLTEKKPQEFTTIGDVKYPVTEVELPSRGILYDPNDIPPVIKIRPMTTREEKILYSSNASSALDMVIKNCVVEPVSLNLSHLIMPDKYALLVNLRIISVGSSYYVTPECEHCDEQNGFEIDLTTLPVDYLDNNFVEPYTLTLDNLGGSTVGIKLLRGRDLDAVDDLVKKLKQKSKTPMVGDAGYTYRLAKYIQEIDGRPVDFAKALKFVESWTTMVSNEFRNKVDDIKVGYDINIVRDCMFCGKGMEFAMPFTGEFFRPSRR
jgi:hypothetical protein